MLLRFKEDESDTLWYISKDVKTNGSEKPHCCQGNWGHVRDKISAV